MSKIYYNSDVAQVCGKNGIIKAVLINYIYNYHKPNIRKGPGYPASISLREFVYRYTHKEKSLWKRSFIKRSDFHSVVTPLIKETFNICLRNDLTRSEGGGVRGWKNLKMLQTAPGLN